MKHITIRPANIDDAPLIGWGLCEAIGSEIVEALGVYTSKNEVKEFFTDLAKLSNSQYSWKNALIAEVDNTPAGVAVAYDGSKLAMLREAFMHHATEKLKLNFQNVQDETDNTEFYLDTLAVKPEFRGLGIASKLIVATAKRAEQIGKPLGLLVDDDNVKAQALYKKNGFVTKGRRPFAGVEMSHMQKIQ